MWKSTAAYELIGTRRVRIGRSKHYSAGVTLVELLMVIGLSAILTATAAPAFLQMLSGSRVSNSSNELFFSLLLTRSEAIKRNSRAVICKSSTGQRCDAAGGWEHGWLVFHDANNNGQIDASEAVILRQGDLGPTLSVKGNSPVAKYVSYTALGETQYVSGSFQAGTITICTRSASKTEGRQIVINSVGRPRVVKKMLARCPEAAS